MSENLINCQPESLLLELFTERERFFEEGTLSKQQFIELEDLSAYCWRHTTYSIEQVLVLRQAKGFIEHADASFVQRIFKEAGVLLTPKDLKKGKKAMFLRLKKHFFKKRVRDLLKMVVETIIKKDAAALTDNPTIEKLDELIEDNGFEITYWLIAYHLQNEKLDQLCTEHYPEKKLLFYLETFAFYKNEEFENVMNNEFIHPEDKQRKEQVLKQQNSSLKKKVARFQKNQSTLNTTLYQMKSEKKALQKEIHTLYEEAVQEIEELKKAAAEQEQSIQEEREFYREVIQNLASFNEDHEASNQFEGDLQGATICLVGGTKKKPYADIVEHYNGTLRHVSADHVTTLEGAIQNSSACFYLSTMNSHAQFKAFKICKSLNKPFVFLNSLGSSTFERNLKSFIYKMNS